MSWLPSKLSDKTKQIVRTTANWVVVLIAYTYLIYQLCTTDWSVVTVVSAHWIYLLPIVALMPINVLLEALKWRCLLHNVYPMSVMEALRQVLYGFVGSMITPYRAGDYPARMMLMRDKNCWPQAIALGIYGSVVLTGVILLAGVGPFCAYMGYATPSPYLVLPVLLSLLLVVHKRMEGGKIALLCMARYAVFCVQLYLMLRCIGVEISIVDAICRIPYYYLLVTITPNIPISDPAIRGSWAIIAFGPAGAVAALGLWVINTVLPTLIGGIQAIPTTRGDRD